MYLVILKILVIIFLIFEWIVGIVMFESVKVFYIGFLICGKKVLVMRRIKWLFVFIKIENYN